MSERSRNSSSTSYYSCISHVSMELHHADSKLSDKKGFQSQTNLFHIDTLEKENKTLKELNTVLEEESTGYKHCISTLKEELDLKTNLIQKLMLKLQTQKTNQSEMNDCEAYYKDELHSRSCELELTKRMLNEFHKVFKSVEERANLAEKQVEVLSVTKQKQEKLIRKQSKHIEQKEQHFKTLEMKFKQLQIFRRIQK